MGNFSEKIADSLERIGTIPTEEKALYEYGIRQGLFMVINIATIVFIGLLLNVVLQSIIFMIVYIPLRSFAGGYHARTQLSCYLLSVLVVAIVFWGIDQMPWNGYLVGFIMVYNVIMLWRFAPVEDQNKRLDEMEIYVFRKKTRTLTGGFAMIGILLWILDLQILAIAILAALFLAAFMVMLGAMKNKIIKSPLT